MDLESMAAEAAQLTRLGVIEPAEGAGLFRRGPFTRLLAQVCRACGAPADQRTNLKDKNAVPKAGDPEICITCGHVVVHDGQGDVREPSVPELKALLADPEVSKVRQWIREHGDTEEIELEAPRALLDHAKRIAAKQGRSLDDLINDSVELKLSKERQDRERLESKAHERATGEDAAAGLSAVLRRDLATDAKLAMAPIFDKHLDLKADVRNAADANFRLGLVQDRLAHLRRLSDEKALIEDVLTDLLEKAEQRPSEAAVKAVREAMAQNLAAKDGIPIDDARAHIDFLEQMREGVEKMREPAKTFPEAIEAIREERHGPPMKWPHVNAPRADQMWDERMPTLPCFHVSAAMEADLSEAEDWKFSEQYAYWPPFPEFGLLIDPHADRLGLHVMFDRSGEHEGAYAFLPEGIHVCTSPERYRERVGVFEVGQFREGIAKAKERFGDDLNVGHPSADTWTITIRGRMFWYENLPRPAEGELRLADTAGSPDAAGPEMTLMAMWSPGQPSMFPVASPLDTEVDDFLLDCMKDVAHRYLGVALNFVLLLNNRDVARQRINHPTDGMNRQQRRAWERENGPAREEWHVRVKPKRADDLGALVRESAACENVERKLPGRHTVRGHIRHMRSGKIVQITPFEKCTDRPWAHRERTDSPEYDAWSLQKERGR